MRIRLYSAISSLDKRMYSLVLIPIKMYYKINTMDGGYWIGIMKLTCKRTSWVCKALTVVKVITDSFYRKYPPYYRAEI